MTDDLDALHQAVALGFDIEAFRKTEIGKYFDLCAQNEILNGLQELKGADPFEPRQIVAIQNRIYIAEQFFVWLARAADDAKNAMAAVEISDSTPADSVG